MSLLNFFFCLAPVRQEPVPSPRVADSASGSASCPCFWHTLALSGFPVVETPRRGPDCACPFCLAVRCLRGFRSLRRGCFSLCTPLCSVRSHSCAPAFSLTFSFSSPLSVMASPSHSVGEFAQFSDWDLTDLYEEINKLSNTDWSTVSVLPRLASIVAKALRLQLLTSDCLVHSRRLGLLMFNCPSEGHAWSHERPYHWPYLDLFLLYGDELPDWIPLQDLPLKL